MVHSDTDLFPSGAGTAASRGTVVGASALYLVLQQSRTKLASLASHILGCSVDDISFRDGNVLGGETQRKLSFAELAAAAYSEEMLPADMTPGLDFDGSYSLPSNTYAYGPHVAVVEVDQDTGEIKLLRYVALNDCGPIINPMLVEGQLHGGIVQGIGQALTEGMVYGQDGQPATGSLMDYALPFAEEIPDMVLETMETPSPITPMGVKGVGELPTVAAPVAVANAVMDALAGAGVHHIDTPLTPEKVWRALNGQDAR